MTTSDQTRDMGAGRRTAEDGRSQLDETKHALKTTEFWAFVGLFVALAIAGTSIDGFDAGRVWLYITILAVGYMVSRASRSRSEVAVAATRRRTPTRRRYYAALTVTDEDGDKDVFVTEVTVPRGPAPA